MPSRLYSLNVFWQQGARDELIEQLAQREAKPCARYSSMMALAWSTTTSVAACGL